MNSKAMHVIFSLQTHTTVQTSILKTDMKYSIIKVIKNDWPSLAAFIGLPITWTIFTFFPLLKKSSQDISFLFPLILTFFLVFVLTWRILRIKRLFDGRNIIAGTINHIVIVKDRGRLEFSFNYNGSTISSWMPVHKTKEVLYFESGTPVTVAFNPDKPTDAIVLDLFTK